MVYYFTFEYFYIYADRKYLWDSPDSMTRATCDLFDPQVLGSRTNRDTVVTGFDGSVTDLNIGR